MRTSYLWKRHHPFENFYTQTSHTGLTHQGRARPGNSTGMGGISHHLNNIIKKTDPAGAYTSITHTHAHKHTDTHLTKERGVKGMRGPLGWVGGWVGGPNIQRSITCCCHSRHHTPHQANTDGALHSEKKEVQEVTTAQLSHTFMLVTA